MSIYTASAARENNKDQKISVSKINTKCKKKIAILDNYFTLRKFMADVDSLEFSICALKIPISSVRARLLTGVPNRSARHNEQAVQFY